MIINQKLAKELKLFTGKELTAYGLILLFLFADIVHCSDELVEKSHSIDSGFWEAAVELPLLLITAGSMLYLLTRNIRKRKLLLSLSSEIGGLCDSMLAGAESETAPEKTMGPNESLVHNIRRSEEVYKRLLSYKEQVQHERDFYTHILNETPSFIVWLNLDGTVKYCNPALLHATGYTQQDLLGKNWWDVFYPGGEKNSQIEELNNISANGRRDVHDHVMMLKTKAGENRYISWTTANILDTGGNPVELIGLGADITEERTRAEKAAEEQKMKALAGLAGGLAHEISNALQPILGISEICALQAEGKDEKLHESMRIIQRNALHCRNIVNGVLTFARRDVRKIETYDLRALLEEAMEFTDEFMPPDVQVVCKGFGDGMAADALAPLRATINRTEFVQVMANLFANASHAMKNSGVIEVALDETVIDGTNTKLDSLPAGKYAVVTVKDRGHGMTEDVQKSIFQPFFTTKKVGEGTGLGLAAVYGIMKSWNGTVRVQSQPGAGSTFYLYFPAANGSEPSRAAFPDELLQNGELNEDGKHTRH